MQDRVGVAVAVARQLGLHVGGVQVLRAGALTTVVEVGGLVARVSEPGFGVREAVAVAEHAAARGGPVVPPARLVDPGPHERQGLVVLFWERVDSPETAEARLVGRRLRELHETLADCSTPLAGFAHPADALRRLAMVGESQDHELLREALSFPLGAGQALHGDAAIVNCIGDGRWIDFDLTAQGPPEADLATLVLRDRVHARDGESAAALAAYGPCDLELIQVCLRVFVALTCVLLLEQTTQTPSKLLAERLAWLRSSR
jgi:hypothetical protein